MLESSPDEVISEHVRNPQKQVIKAALSKLSLYVEINPVCNKEHI